MYPATTVAATRLIFTRSVTPYAVSGQCGERADLQHRQDHARGARQPHMRDSDPVPALRNGPVHQGDQGHPPNHTATA